MIRAVVVDDEEPARDRLGRLLAEAGGGEVSARRQLASRRWSRSLTDTEK